MEVLAHIGASSGKRDDDRYEAQARAYVSFQWANSINLTRPFSKDKASVEEENELEETRDETPDIVEDTQTAKFALQHGSLTSSRRECKGDSIRTDVDESQRVVRNDHACSEEDSRSFCQPQYHLPSPQDHQSNRNLHSDLLVSERDQQGSYMATLEGKTMGVASVSVPHQIEETDQALYGEAMEDCLYGLTLEKQRRQAIDHTNYKAQITSSFCHRHHQNKSVSFSKPTVQIEPDVEDSQKKTKNGHSVQSDNVEGQKGRYLRLPKSRHDDVAMHRFLCQKKANNGNSAQSEEQQGRFKIPRLGQEGYSCLHLTSQHQLVDTAHKDEASIVQYDADKTTAPRDLPEEQQILHYRKDEVFNIQPVADRTTSQIYIQSKNVPERPFIDFTNLPYNIFVEDPPVGMATSVPPQLNRAATVLKMVGLIPELQDRYNPVERTRELRPYERAKWTVNTFRWSRQVQLEFWHWLQRHGQAGRLGWNITFWREHDKDADENTIRYSLGTVIIFVWPEAVKPIYLALFIASRGNIVGTGATVSTAATGELIIQMR